MMCCCKVELNLKEFRVDLEVSPFSVNETKLRKSQHGQLAYVLLMTRIPQYSGVSLACEVRSLSNYWS